jgi:hypothetical protein
MRLCGSRRGLVAAVAVSLVAVGTVSGGAVVHAAPPSNDDIAGATVIDAIPFHAQQDTTEATTSAEEAAWNDFCGAPTLEQGVWFTATVMNDASNVVVDTTASDYSAGILVLVGDPGALQPVACQPGIVSGPVGAGQTVYLLIFGDGLTGTTSGNLVLDIYPAPPPPEIDVAIDPVGTFDRSGAARISGTVTCTSADPTATVIDLSGSVRQAVGRFAIDGFFFVDLFSPCDGTTQPWEAFVTGNGKFKGGHAATVAVAFGCDSLTCVDGFAEATVKLRGGK